MADPRASRRTALMALMLALLAVVPYLAVAGHGFVDYDDPQYIVENHVVRQGLSWRGLAWAFTSFEHASNWHPVTWLSHALDCAIFAQPDGTQWAGGHHLVNLLLHAANTVVLYLVLT